MQCFIIVIFFGFLFYHCSSCGKTFAESLVSKFCFYQVMHSETEKFVFTKCN